MGPVVNIINSQTTTVSRRSFHFSVSSAVGVLKELGALDKDVSLNFSLFPFLLSSLYWCYETETHHFASIFLPSMYLIHNSYICCFLYFCYYSLPPLTLHFLCIKHILLFLVLCMFNFATPLFFAVIFIFCYPLIFCCYLYFLLLPYFVLLFSYLPPPPS